MRFRVSSDKGKTWKWRWIDRANFDPDLSPLKQGDWIETPKGIRLIRIINGSLEATEPIYIDNKNE